MKENNQKGTADNTRRRPCHRFANLLSPPVDEIEFRDQQCDFCQIGRWRWRLNQWFCFLSFIDCLLWLPEGVLLYSVVHGVLSRLQAAHQSHNLCPNLLILMLVIGLLLSQTSRGLVCFVWLKTYCLCDSYALLVQSSQRLTRCLFTSWNYAPWEPIFLLCKWKEREHNWFLYTTEIGSYVPTRNVGWRS